CEDQGAAIDQTLLHAQLVVIIDAKKGIRWRSAIAANTDQRCIHSEAQKSSQNGDASDRERDRAISVPNGNFIAKAGRTAATSNSLRYPDACIFDQNISQR